MSGHSKWANIKHRKNKQDAVKGKIFTKLIREITVSAKSSQDISANSRLRLAVDKALANNMSRETIDRAIKRGTGGGDGSVMEEVFYEGYAPGGVAILVQCLTDNRNRTVGEVRHAFTKHGGNLGTNGSVAYLFLQRGIICFSPESDEDQIMQVALEASAFDIISDSDKSVEVITTPESFSEVKLALEKAGFCAVAAEISMLPSTRVALDKETSLKVMDLVDVLEELDDVQNVYSNADLSAEIL